MCFHVPLKPRKMDKFLLLRMHTALVIPKRKMVPPPLTTSFINFIVIVIEIHVLRRKKFELAIVDYDGLIGTYVLMTLG